MEVFEVWPVSLLIASLAIGLLVGSFLNVVAYRLPVMMQREWEAEAAEMAGAEPAATETFNLAVPRSRCPHCQHDRGTARLKRSEERFSRNAETGV